MRRVKFFFLVLLSLSLISGMNAQESQKDGHKTVQIKVRNSTSSDFESIYILEKGKDVQWYSIHIPSVEEYRKQKKQEEKNKSSQKKSTDSISQPIYEPEAYISLKTGVEYTIVLVDSQGNQYVKEKVKIDPNNTNVVLDIKKNNKPEKNYVEKYSEELKKDKEQREFDTSIIFTMVGLLSFLLVLFLIGVFSALASGGKENLSRKLMGDGGSTIRVSEILGAVLMLVPVIITLGTYHLNVEKTIFWFFKHSVQKDVNIGVSLTTMLFACVMYGIYIIRYGIFRTDTYLQSVFSIFQTLVNCWVLAGVCSMFVGGEVWSIPFINVSSRVFLILVVVLSLLGARSVAGFAWILLIVAGFGRLTEMDSAMGVYGAIYIAFMFLGLMLQFIGLLKSSDFRNDFIGFARKSGKRIAGDISASAKVTADAVKTVGTVAMAAAGVPPVALGGAQVQQVEEVKVEEPVIVAVPAPVAEEEGEPVKKDLLVPADQR